MGTALLLILFLPWKLAFIFLLIIGSIAAISAPSWIAAWIGLEINILALIALLINIKSPRNSEATLKYFLIQVLASAILVSSVFGISFIHWSIRSLNPFIDLILLRLLIKMGRAPFHLWVPQVIEGLHWINSRIILIWQKLAPLILSIRCFERKIRIFILNLAISLSAIAGAIGGLAQTSTRKILAFSSINHIGWMLLGLSGGVFIWMSYYAIYSLMLASLILILMINNMNSISDISSSLSNFQIITFFLVLLSLGGLPPFLGFGPKWLIILNLRWTNPSLVFLLIIIRLVALFFYIRLTFQTLLIKKRNISFLANSFSLSWAFVFFMNALGLSLFIPLFRL